MCVLWSLLITSLFPASPGHELSPVTSHPSMTPCQSVYRCPLTSKKHHILQDPPSHPDYQLPLYVLREIEFHMAHEPMRDLSLQRCQSPLFPPGNSMQPILQWLPDPERNLQPQVSPEQAMKPSLPIDTNLSTLGTQIVHCSLQMPSCSSVSFGSEGSLSPVMPANKYVDLKVHCKPLN